MDTPETALQAVFLFSLFVAGPLIMALVLISGHRRFGLGAMPRLGIGLLEALVVLAPSWIMWTRETAAPRTCSASECYRFAGTVLGMWGGLAAGILVAVAVIVVLFRRSDAAQIMRSSRAGATPTDIHCTGGGAL